MNVSDIMTMLSLMPPEAEFRITSVNTASAAHEDFDIDRVVRGEDGVVRMTHCTVSAWSALRPAFALDMLAEPVPTMYQQAPPPPAVGVPSTVDLYQVGMSFRRDADDTIFKSYVGDFDDTINGRELALKQLKADYPDIEFRITDF